MPDRIVSVDGVEHHFPSDATDAEISEALNGPTTAKPREALNGPTTAKPRASDALAYAMSPQPIADLAVGAGKGLLSTARGIAHLVLPQGAEDALSAVRQKTGLPPVAEMTQPTNTMQQVGKTAEQVGEFFAPAGVLGKAKAAVTTGRVALDALIGAGIEGASAAGVTSAQQGTTKNAANTGAMVAGTAAVAPAAFKAGGKALEWLGNRTESALIKPSRADVADGFQVGNVFKYRLGGNLQDTYEKSADFIAKKGDELKKYLNVSTQLGRRVNVLDALASVSKDLESEGARHFGQNTSLQNAVNKLADDPFFAKGLAQDGSADISTANEIKQGVGELGAWLHDPTGRVMGDDQKAMETVANRLYAKLKSNIQQQAIGPISAINKQIAEVIPIRQAIIRRIPVEQRANVLNLGDLIGASTGHLGLSLANRVLKSGQFADLAAQAGQGMQAAPALAPAAARLTGATAATLGQP